MSSYVVTGSSKGLGYAFLENLSKNPANTVIGLARSKATLEAKLQKAGITNVHVLQGDVTDRASLKAAAEVTSKITGGKLDVLINNAGFVSEVSGFKTLLDYDSDIEIQENDFLESFKVNALGLVNVVHAFLPLVRKGSVKKVVNLSTGMADLELIHKTELAIGAPYAASKAAANVVVAKYAAALKEEGILFLSMSPGYVSTEANLEADPAGAQAMGAKFAAYAPHFTRPLTPEESITAILGVVGKKSVANGDSGRFVSHLGTQQWL